MGYEFGSAGAENMKVVQTFAVVSLFVSLPCSCISSFDLGQVQMVWARILPPPNGDGVSACARSAER